jgi:3-methyladenine DNA glycosylase AlkD
VETVAAIRDTLRAVADPLRAPQMQAYMKSAMPYLGVPVPEVRRIVRREVRAHPLPSLVAVEAAAARLWREADYREERYAAAALTALPIARGHLELLPLLREFIVTGAWWEHVDEAAHRIGELLQAHREQVTPVLREWSVADDRWLRRVSIIAQLGAKGDLDRELLTAAIEANLGDRDFFIRKAIGWALRDYGWHDPQWVRRFVDTHPTLSPLSQREALKNIEKLSGCGSV